MFSQNPRLLGVALLVPILLLLAGRAEAKRFKYYPDSGAGDEKPATDQPAPPPSTPNKPQEPTSEGGPPEVRFGQIEEDPAQGEPEEAAGEGIFAPLLHGRNGIVGQYIYTGEVFTNLRGGISTNDATRYLGVLDVAITADLEKLSFPLGGTFFIYGQEIHGQGLTEEFVGDYQWLSNIDAPPRTQISEYWWQRSILDDRLTFRFGKQDANTEFAVLDSAGDFVQSSFGFHPTIPMPTYPDAAMGAVALYTPCEWLALKAGVFDGAADGRTWGFSGTGEAFSIYEVETMWSLLDGRLPGDFHAGIWYHNGQFDELTGAATFCGDHGVYFGAEQLVVKESWDPEDDQGLGVFVQYDWAPDDRNEASRYFGCGLVYQGLLPCRDDDVTGLGVASIRFSDLLPEQTNETTVELFHKVQWSRYISILPDLQYIARPSGQYRDAIACGLRFELVL